MHPQDPGPVKLFIAILYSKKKCLDKAFQCLKEKYGEMDYQSQQIDFSITDYYQPEMGRSIYRIFVSFSTLIRPDEIARIKIETNEIEDTLAIGKKRKVNLDAGYMDYDKVVLASAKYNGQKIYLDMGIWADLTLHYEKGRFDPYPWSFPDFKTGMYNDVFLEIRRRFKQQRKTSS
jgi:hypothetical protein